VGGGQTGCPFHLLYPRRFQGRRRYFLERLAAIEEWPASSRESHRFPQHTSPSTNSRRYSVCVDFQDGENTYDVDFLVDRTTEGLSVSDHYLHKINGEAVE